MSIISNITKCRICNSETLQNVIDLGEQYITSRFPVYGDFTTPKTPITLCMCMSCSLLQLLQTTHNTELYEYEYGYRSGITNTMKMHLKQYQSEICSMVDLCENDTVVDIGSNDSTMLQYYGDLYRRIGVDPTGKQFSHFYGDVQLLPNYFTYENVVERFGEIKCKIVSSISMFYDLPDPVQFAKDVYSILDDDGIWTCEQSYLLTMLRTNSIDTICHEHLEYYSLHQIKEIADRANLKIIHVGFNSCNGGSFRIYFAKRESTRHTENIELIERILKDELDYGIQNPEIYVDFMEKCNVQIKRMKDCISNIIANGKRVYVYGASTKGNCLLQYSGLDQTYIQYAVERNPIKFGKMTSTGIEIISEEIMRDSPPDYLLVLPWHFKNEILEREKSFLDKGGQMIFPFPEFEIIGTKPKVLITGCDGMIAHYVKPLFEDSYLYGFSRRMVTYEPSITKFYFDMRHISLLENALNIIKPDIIIHLASISSSHYALNHPTEAIYDNGILVSQLCQIIHTNNWSTKLFHASSSEIYKGHINYIVSDNDSNMFHLHPYSISKMMGHSMVDFYRTVHNRPFSNGVIFTTESHLKKPEFLLNKVAKHIKYWKLGKRTPLVVGNMDSYRNIIHASDVANAIHTIIKSDYCGSILICNKETNTMFDLIKRLFLLSGLPVEFGKTSFFVNGDVILNIDSAPVSDITPTNINGFPTKLIELGWNPHYSVDDILRSLLSEE